MKLLRTITPRTARRLAISRQGLADPVPEGGKDGLMNLLRDLGCLQIDPIRAVERTQYLVLWSRLGRYEPALLDELLWEDRQLFEFWAHCASIVLTEDYPIFQVHMEHWLNGDQAWKAETRSWMADNVSLRNHVIEELALRGPLASREITDHSQSDWQSTGWTNGRNVDQMMRALWRLGHVMVSHRQGNAKFWDLSERCLPSWTPQDKLEWQDAVYLAAQRSLRALGVATPKQIENHFTRGRYPGLEQILAQLEGEGLVIPVAIGDERTAWPGNWYLHREDLGLLNRLERGDWHPRTTLLSPFDNLICDRERTEMMFDFRFRIEIYVPKAKRQYGYYVLPILHGDHFIGRLDPKMDRKRNQLQIQAIYAEDGVPKTVNLGRAVVAAIEDLASFLGATSIEYGSEIPAGWQAAFY